MTRYTGEQIMPGDCLCSSNYYERNITYLIISKTNDPGGPRTQGISDYVTVTFIETTGPSGSATFRTCTFERTECFVEGTRIRSPNSRIRSP